MKKFISILFALMLLFSAAGCGGTGAKDENTKNGEAQAQASGNSQNSAGVANPMTEYESLEELNEAFGCRLAKPGVMGVSEESFTSITGGEHDIAQYKFTVAGSKYTLRYSPSFTGDISGIYVAKGTLFSLLEDGEEANIATSDYFGARWYNIDGQYCLTVPAGNGLTAEGFASCAEELEYLTRPANLAGLPEYSQLAGSYQDSYSQRASAEVEECENGVTITISWSSSAEECDEWIIPAYFTEDGLLSYSEGNRRRIVYNSDGSEKSSETIAEAESGYFVFDEENGRLLWEGAADENCAECVFEKMPE